MVSPPGFFLLSFFLKKKNALTYIFCFSYDIDHLNGHDDATKHHHQHQHHEHFNRASTTQHVEMAMATAAGARDATRLELVCLFYFIFILFYYYNVFLGYSTYGLG